jgi:hypothetical protein
LAKGETTIKGVATFFLSTDSRQRIIFEFVERALTAEGRCQNDLRRAFAESANLCGLRRNPA